uniref:Uncharacterized protein n=1 Tax=Romanomermis culicivorax TaxID=13658 RepID=A0A915KLF5_ROMCU
MKDYKIYIRDSYRGGDWEMPNGTGATRSPTQTAISGTANGYAAKKHCPALNWSDFLQVRSEAEVIYIKIRVLVECVVRKYHSSYSTIILVRANWKDSAANRATYAASREDEDAEDNNDDAQTLVTMDGGKC